jgi:hypothetical protein
VPPNGGNTPGPSPELAQGCEAHPSTSVNLWVKVSESETHQRQRVRRTRTPPRPAKHRTIRVYQSGIPSDRVGV